jgi:SAM-dependent methyltransferase
MASLGCGTGALERHLALLQAFRRCDAFDIAPGALEVARREAAAAGVTGLHYERGDIERLILPVQSYDAIWVNGSLHHVSNLEGVCDGVAAALKPDGHVFLSEYVGADRFDLPERQKAAIRAAFELIPERYRCSFDGGIRGPVQSVPRIPDPRAVAAADPSEAVRSSAILEVVERRFEVVARHNAGGTILQFLLQGISGNFRTDDPGSLSPFGRVEALAFRRKLQRETVRRWPDEHYVQPCLRPMAGGQVAPVRPSCPTPADGGSVAGYGRHGDHPSLSSRRQPTLIHFQWSREAIGFSRWSVH